MEDHISQITALMLLVKLYYKYLSSKQTLEGDLGFITIDKQKSKAEKLSTVDAAIGLTRCHLGLPRTQKRSLIQ